MQIESSAAGWAAAQLIVALAEIPAPVARALVRDPAWHLALASNRLTPPDVLAEIGAKASATSAELALALLRNESFVRTSPELAATWALGSNVAAAIWGATAPPDAFSQLLDKADQLGQLPLRVAPFHATPVTVAATLRIAFRAAVVALEPHERAAFAAAFIEHDTYGTLSSPLLAADVLCDLAAACSSSALEAMLALPPIGTLGCERLSASTMTSPASAVSLAAARYGKVARVLADTTPSALVLPVRGGRLEIERLDAAEHRNLPSFRLDQCCTGCAADASALLAVLTPTALPSVRAWGRDRLAASGVSLHDTLSEWHRALNRAIHDGHLTGSSPELVARIEQLAEMSVGSFARAARYVELFDDMERLARDVAILDERAMSRAPAVAPTPNLGVQFAPGVFDPNPTSTIALVVKMAAIAVGRRAARRARRHFGPRRLAALDALARPADPRDRASRVATTAQPSSPVWFLAHLFFPSALGRQELHTWLPRHRVTAASVDSVASGDVAAFVATVSSDVNEWLTALSLMAALNGMPSSMTFAEVRDLTAALLPHP